jgi:hypothetical protein
MVRRGVAVLKATTNSLVFFVPMFHPICLVVDWLVKGRRGKRKYEDMRGDERDKGNKRVQLPQ